MRATALTKLTRVELKLFVRDPAAAFFTLVFPMLLLVLNGTGGGNEPADDLGGKGRLDVIVPMLIVMVLAILAFTTLPVYLASYRERRILRRIAATPVPAGAVLVAELLVHLIVGTAALMGLLALGMIAYDVNAPRMIGAAGAAYVLGGLSLFALGFLLAALAPSARAAEAIGLGLFFPLLFLSGLMQPRETMPDSLGKIGDVLPVAPVVRSLRDAWSGEPPTGLTYALFVAIIVIAGGAAVRLFRWE